MGTRRTRPDCLQGKLLPGSHIPIVSDAVLYAPQVCFHTARRCLLLHCRAHVLAWV